VGSGHTLFGSLVGACRNSVSDVLQLNPSHDDNAGAAPDGSDYIEGAAGGDVIFGNQGQDDIVGGSSDLFSLTTPDRRPDAADVIFGASGGPADLARNAAGDLTAEGHAHDADAIAGDNAEILRIL